MLQRFAGKVFSTAVIMLLLISSGVAADSSSSSNNKVVDKRQEVDRVVEQRVAQLNAVIVAAESKLEAANKALSAKDYETALKLAQQARDMVAPLSGPVSASKLKTIDLYIGMVKNHWAVSLVGAARKAFLEEKYDLATTTAQRAIRIDSACEKEASGIVKMCEKKLNYKNIKAATSLEKLDPDYAKRQDDIKVMLKNAQTLIDNKMYDKARDTLEKILLKDPLNQSAVSMLNDVYQRLYAVAEKRRQVEFADRMQQLEFAWNEQVLPGEGTKIETQAPEVNNSAKTSLQEKMQKIIFDNLEFDDASITSVIQHLNTLSKQADPQGGGVSIVSNLSSTESAEIPRITMSFDHIPMLEAIRYICQGTGLKFKVEEKAVIIGDKNIDPMDTMFFKVRAALISSIAGGGTDTAKAAEDRDKFTEKDGGAGDLADTFKKDKNKASKKSTAAATTTAEGGGGVTSATGEALKKYFMDRGIPFDEGATIAYDRRAGKLIVKNTYDNLRKLEHLLRDLDIQTPLVLIEAKIVEMTQTDLEELGFDWVFSSPGSSSTHPHWSLGENSELLRHYSSSNSNSFDSADRNYKMINDLKLLPNFGGENSDFNLSLTVNAIDQNSKQEVLSAPKVIATSGTTALIRMVEQTYYPDSWSDPELSVSSSSFEFTPPKPEFGEAMDIGIRFEVTPTVSPNNYTISLHLVPQVIAFSGWQQYPIYMTVGTTVIGSTDPTDTNLGTYIKMPIISRRDLDTNVKVFDGETIVLGGMLQDVAEERNDKWPLLGDIPLLGRLFRSQMSKSEKVNLLIFVTARLVNNDGVPVRENVQRGLPDFNR